jgi:hypothetical protein
LNAASRSTTSRRFTGKDLRTGARDAYKRRREQDIWVYFAELPDGCIKIGATVNVRQRMSQLHGRCLASCRGGFQREQAEHRRFAHLRIEGEREKYRPEPDLLEYVAFIEADPRQWTRATTVDDLASYYRRRGPASEDTKLLVEFMNGLAGQI